MSSPATTVSVVGEGAADADIPPRRPHAPRPARKKNFAPAWLLSPAGIVILTLIGAPIAFLVFTSFTDYSQRSLFTGEFSGVGFDQYVSIFTNPDFWWSVWLTLIFTATMVAGSMVVGMAVSQLLTRMSSRMRYVVTVALILAWAMPNVASSVVWNWLFQPGYGVINWLMTQTHVFGDMTNVNWAQSPTLAYAAIWLLIVWQAVPFIALTLYAAQSQVPAEYFEAARLDGAGEWRIYRTVTLVFLRPTILLFTILSIIWDFNVFNQIWLVSQGGPGNATSTLGIFTYKEAFVSFHLGEGAAIAVVTTVMLMALTAFYIRALIRSGEEL